MSEIKDTSKCGYYYHPLGELAKAFADGTADDSEWPHTYDLNESGKLHGIGNLDWGSGSHIPPNSKVYAMTNGTITKIFKNTREGGIGFYIYIKTDRVDGVGKPIEIHYIELSGFSERIAGILGCKSGPMTEKEFNMAPINFSSEIVVEMGEHIGYTNSWYSNFSNMHTDFVYIGRGDNDSNGDVSEENYPHATEDKLSNSFKLTNLSNGVKKVECNDKIVGRENGYVRRQGGASSATYKVWPHMSYMVCQQTPVYINSSSGILGEVGKYAPKGYDSKILDCSEKELLGACNAILGETMAYTDGLEAARSGVLMYAKLLRCRTLWYGEDVQYTLGHSGLGGHSGTHIDTRQVEEIGYTVEEFKEKVRLNLCNPGLYDITYPKCVQIVKNAPFFNYGYFNSGYTVCSSSVEAELENKIKNRTLPGHFENSDIFLGCTGNTGYWSLASWKFKD